MSSTDTSLTVVNSMTEEYLESLKDSSGKIPSLANQLIMTNDEVDVSNIDIENVTAVYDMSSTDASLNWGLTSGILGNVTAYRDLTAYEKLIFVPRVYNISSINTGGWSGNYVLDLTTKKPDDNWCVAGYTSAYSDSAATGEVNKETWNFLFFYNPTDKELKWRVTFNGNNWNNNANCYIAKIYGVKKKNLGVIAGGGTKITTLYDMSSSDSSINKGYTSGVQAGQDFSIDLMDYKYVRVWIGIANGIPKLAEIDMTKQANSTDKSGYLYGTSAFGSFTTQYDLLKCMLYVNNDKNKLYYEVYNQTGWSSRSNVSSITNFKIYKIEGVKL